MPKVRCFVAMAFGHEDVDIIYEKVIKQALKELGIGAVRVDRVTHNDRIDSKIRSEILKADLLIADLTFARPSVYWEAGYAERVGPVIYTCRTDHFTRRSEKEDPNEILRVHFDLQNANIIRWSEKNKSSFKKQLMDRIRLVTAPLKSKNRQTDVVSKSRSSFAQKSLLEKGRTAYEIISSTLATAGYYFAPGKHKLIYDVDWDQDEHRPSTIYQIAVLRERLVGTTLIRLFITYPRVKLEEKYLRDLLLGSSSPYKEGMLSPRPIVWERLPPYVKRRTRRTVLSIRNIWLLSALDKVPDQRPQKILPAYRKIGNQKYFFRPTLSSSAFISKWERTEELHLIPTSSEVFFIDEIRSQVETKVNVMEFIKTIEGTSITVVKPDVKVIPKNQERQ